ncbi:hypothetical protein Lesp02_52590 [Lentzea sp. NBRC 105346]|uniref:beta strand repeat-containing protein n=1 Tax=Lentzea sp. NBRC 105346 TaxID=3032205 RepID=UPI0024A06C6D|nr:chaplin family protein [Lentzea sp. NBRC 105346]GLZ33071.1 hypothetical protein Lesp02_52590 [Lentzea sp. NBRC 105346]
MHTWAKRGIQTAFVTGGLLMLGTGIASAQENVNPDAPPSPVDAGVSVPIKVDQNNLGTPVKNVDVPKIERTISTDRVTSAVPTRTAAPAANPLVRNASERLQHSAVSGVFRGNTIQAHWDIPINICGNAIAVFGDAYAAGDCSQSSHRETPIVTDGSGQALAGNIVAVDWVSPFQITGNAIAAAGNAETDTHATQDSYTGGDRETSGEQGAISGNILAGQWATPFQITGNGVGGAGIANAKSDADTTAVSDGSLKTSGDKSTLSGNVGGVPLAPLFEVNGNSVAGAGNASTDSRQAGKAVAGGTHTGINDIATWVETTGDPATGAGNVVQPQLAGPISVDDNAGAVGGNSDASSDTMNDATAGGFTSTTGEGSTASGNIADAPIALPVSGAGDSAAVIGNATTDHTNDSTTEAGSGTYTNGDNSVLSANTASVPPATSVDVCGDSAAGGGQATGTCTNDVESTAGGYNGTTGNESVGSGNIGTVPVAVPVETYGVTAAGAGSGTATATEEKDVRSSGTPNTEDDKGTVSSNIATAPTAAAPQVIGNTAGLVANTTTDTTQDTSVTAGGNPHATGKKSSLSGNIAQVPTSTPAQVFGTGATGVGNNDVAADNSTDMKAGGDASSTGEKGSLTGNIVSVPAGTGTQVQGQSVGAGGNVDSDSSNDLNSVAGGSSATNGDEGSVAGNVISADTADFAHTPGNSVSGAGITGSDATSATNVVAGGDEQTSGQDASVSGNLIGVPNNTYPGVFGDAVASLGSAETNTDSVNYTQAGGATETDGSGPLTGREIQAPVEAAAKVKDVPAEVVGQAVANTTEDSTQVTGDEGEGVRADKNLKGIELPKGVDHLMGATEMPSFSGLDKLPVNQTPDPEKLAGLAGELPTQGVPALPQERSSIPVGGSAANLNPNVQGVPLQEVLGLAGTLVPGAQQRSLPTVPSLPFTAPALPMTLPAVPLATQRSATDLPALPLEAPTSLSGVSLNPASSLAQEERTLPAGPALNVVDTKTVFAPVSGLL